MILMAKLKGIHTLIPTILDRETTQISYGQIKGGTKLQIQIKGTKHHQVSSKRALILNPNLSPTLR